MKIILIGFSLVMFSGCAIIPLRDMVGGERYIIQKEHSERVLPPPQWQQYSPRPERQENQQQPNW